MPKRIPFRLKNGDEIVIWTHLNGDEIELTWEQFDELVHTLKYKEYIAVPKKDFEEYYKRFKLPAEKREYHAKYKRDNYHSQKP